MVNRIKRAAEDADALHGGILARPPFQAIENSDFRFGERNKKGPAHP
jgi:hypothetical protein